MNISKIKINLYIYNLLLKPKGSISNKEFLIGITVLFLIAFYQTLTENILILSPSLSYHNRSVITISSLNATPSAFTLPTSFSSIIFLSSLILCYKRAIDLNYTITKGIIFGIILYFGFTFNFMNSIHLLAFYSLNEARIIEETSNYMSIYNLLSVVITLFAIFLIVYLSIKKGKKEKPIDENRMSSYILNLGKITLFFIGYIFILGLLSFFVKPNNKIIGILLGIAILIVLIYYLYLNYKISKSYRVLFYFNLSALIVYLILVVGHFFLVKMSENFIILKFFPSILTIINMLFLLSSVSFILVETSEKKQLHSTKVTVSQNTKPTKSH